MMTICLSVIHNDKIIAFCDTIARHLDGRLASTNERKFIPIPKGKSQSLILLLIYGDFSYLMTPPFEGEKDLSNDPRLIIDKFVKPLPDDTVSDIVLKITNAFRGKTTSNDWKIQVCVFDDNKPKIDEVTGGGHRPNSHASWLVSSIPEVEDFFEEKKDIIEHLPENLEEAKEHLKNLVLEAIQDENERRGDKHLTGGDGIYSLVLHPTELCIEFFPLKKH